MLAGGAIEPELYAEFVRRAGGADAEIVYVPTAAQSVDIDETRAYVRENAAEVGAVAGEHDRAAHARLARGRHRRVRRAAGNGRRRVVQRRAAVAPRRRVLGTKTLEGFWSVLERGGIIGGSSAGATIQGSFLVRGDTETNEIMMGNHQEGFGFLPQSAVDQHLLARDRQYDLIPVIEAHPELLGIGIDENTALVVRGDTARVVGESVVAIYDHRRWTRADSTLDPDDQFFFLQPGDQLDLRTRQELAPAAR